MLRCFFWKTKIALGIPEQVRESGRLYSIKAPVDRESLEALEGIVGLLRDLTPEEEKRFNEAIKRRENR